MDQKKMLKQMIDFNNAAFNNSFNTMVTLQEQMEKATNALIDQANWLPEEGKKVIRDWVGAYKEGREKYKASMDENFKKVEEFFKTAS
jgi:polyhydroxyalkanoate synthesis regulator phasin